MAFGINGTTNLSVDNIVTITNVTEPAQILINVNNDIYGGYLYFILLLLAWYIMYKISNEAIDQPLNNAMYSGAVVSVVSLIFRGVNMTRDGVIIGLLSDNQMWVFPVVTILLATIIYAGRERD